MLLGLFVVFKLFDKNLVNLLLTAYFVVRQKLYLPSLCIPAHSTIFDLLNSGSWYQRFAA